MKTHKNWFITGAGKGFGFEIAKLALAAGDKVVATVRKNASQLATALNNHPNLLVVTMDVVNEQEVRDAVETSIATFGHLDVVVNNAGYGMVTAIEEASDAEVRKQYDTNVFGLLNVVRAVLPHLRAQRSGHIINISSLFGYAVIPGWALYGSSKFAVEGISKGLALELADFGIKVSVVAPGLFRTQFLSQESYAASAGIIDDYNSTMVGQMRLGADHLHGNQAGDPVKFAQVILELANTANPPLHLPVGQDAVETFRKSVENTSKEVEEWVDRFTATAL